MNVSIKRLIRPEEVAYTALFSLLMNHQELLVQRTRLTEDILQSDKALVIDARVRFFLS